MNTKIVISSFNGVALLTLYAMPSNDILKDLWNTILTGYEPIRIVKICFARKDLAKLFKVKSTGNRKPVCRGPPGRSWWTLRRWQSEWPPRWPRRWALDAIRSPRFRGSTGRKRWSPWFRIHQLFFKNTGQPRPLVRLFSTFQANITIFYNK